MKVNCLGKNFLIFYVKNSFFQPVEKVEFHPIE